MPELTLRASVLLSAQKALLGEVTPNLRGVTVGWKDQIISVWFYFDGEITEDDEELASEVETGIIGDFPEDWKVKSKVIQKDFPEPMDEMLTAWVYRRREFFDE